MKGNRVECAHAAVNKNRSNEEVDLSSPSPSVEYSKMFDHGLIANVDSPLNEEFVFSSKVEASSMTIDG